jgi:hypothetical protein
LRILEFNVSKQRISKKQDCDFSGLVAGSVGYLYAKFYFSEQEWNRCTDKVARFWIGEREYAILLGDDTTCVIPPEVLIGKRFEVSVIGAANGYKIETNKINIRQEVN